jgi:hypothetical protein
VGLHKREQPAGSQEQTDDQMRRQALQGELKVFTMYRLAPYRCDVFGWSGTPAKPASLSRLVHVHPCTAELSLVVWDVRILRQFILGVVYIETWGSLGFQ